MSEIPNRDLQVAQLEKTLELLKLHAYTINSEKITIISAISEHESGCGQCKVRYLSAVLCGALDGIPFDAYMDTYTYHSCKCYDACKQEFIQFKVYPDCGLHYRWIFLNLYLLDSLGNTCIPEKAISARLEVLRESITATKKVA